MNDSAICPIIFLNQELNIECEEDDENFDENGEKIVELKSVACVIPGKPFAKQRPRASKRGYFTTIYTPKETVDYENLVKYSYYEQNGHLMLDGPLQAEIIGTFPVPLSASGKQTQRMLNGEVKHTKKPDCDNMAKIVLDALNEVAYHDDAQIVDLRIRKQYGENPNVIIKLSEMPKE